MKALVAGGAGFIGSHLVDALIAEGDRVVCVDNFFIGTRANIEYLKNKASFSFYEKDICDLDELKRIFEAESPDYVFHLAANSDIQASAKNPCIEYNNTYTTTFNLLECMRLYNVKKLFFSSTSAVYGEKDGVDVSEDDCKLDPVSYYGGAKLGSEGMISAYTYMNDFHSLVFRFPNVIGPRLTHGVIFDFLNKLRLNNNSLQILGDGKQSKPYMHISDLIKGIILLKDATKGVTTYNIGVNSQTTVTRIANIICDQMELSNVRFDYTGGRGGWKGDVPVFSYDLSKIHNTGWHAAYSSDEAVIQTVKDILS